PRDARARPQGFRGARLARRRGHALRHVPAHAAHRVRHAPRACGAVRRRAHGAREEATAGMLRSGVMRPCLRTLPAFALALCLASAATAQSTPPYSSLLVVFERDVPVAHERSRIRDMGDSLVVEATAERTFRDEKGGRHPL